MSEKCHLNWELTLKRGTQDAFRSTRLIVVRFATGKTYLKQPRQAAIWFILISVLLDVLSFGVLIPVVPNDSGVYR